MAEQVQEKEQVKKWGRALMSGGYTLLPNALIMNQKRIGLDPINFAIVAVLAKHWWKASELPFPGKNTIADAIGVDARTVQRRLGAMVKAKLLRRHERKKQDGGTNAPAYELVGMIAKATIYAEASLAGRAAVAAKRATRGRGLRPRVAAEK
jgi:hypothetical protein